MCTITFVPREHGYHLAMNRDERITREPAREPEVFALGPTRAAYPYEPATRGTWIAANDAGVALCVLNWNLGVPPEERERSRGSVIPQLIGRRSFVEVERAARDLDLAGVLPFRMVGVFPRERLLCEWRWDRKRLEHALAPWQPRHWYSSGMSDEEAEANRSHATAEAWRRPGAGAPEWIRELHRSHLPSPGAFSVCVHRDDARTVSFSEVEVNAGRVVLRYRAGSPCDPAGEVVEVHLTPAAVHNG